MSFAADMKRFEVSVDNSINSSIRKIAYDLYNRIVNNTPVDTGRARANWNMSEGVPDSTVTENTSRQMVEGLLSPKVAENTVWITNYLHYVYELEHGKSKQAPQGMVVLSIMETVSWVNSKLGVL